MEHRIEPNLRRRTRLLGAVVALSLSHAPAAYAGDPSAALDLADILRIVIRENANVRAADLEVRVREAERWAVAAHMFPTVRVEANAMVWDDAFVFRRFQDELGPIFQGLAAGQPLPNVDLNLHVRDQAVLTTQAMVIEPLGRLWQLHEGQAAKGEMVEAAREDARAKRLELEAQVVSTYYDHISAVKMSKTVEAALLQVDAFEKKTTEYLEQGLVERDALLRVQLQRRQLEQSRIQAAKGVALTRAMLDMLMNRPLDAPLEIACLAAGSDCSGELTPTLASTSLDALQTRAVEDRPDLRSGRHQRDAAERGRHAKKAAFLPDLNLLGAYQHNEGTGEIMPKNSAFVGLSLQWNVFEWGATKAEWDAADHQWAKAVAAIEAAESGVRLQVQQKKLDLDEAQAKAEAAKAELALADEVLRLEQARYEVQHTTAADLLAAQTGVLRATNELTVAEMKVHAARHDLYSALGGDLLSRETVEPTAGAGPTAGAQNPGN